MHQNKNRACLFVRVSTQQQDFDRQVSELKAYCEGRGLTVVKIISAKVSGAKTYKDREDLKELFSAANKGQFDKVIISELSRLGRNARDVRNSIYHLHERKIPIVFYNLGGLESLDERGEESFVTNIIVSVFSELSQEERRLLSERVKSGLNNARRKGKVLGRPGGKEDDKAVLKKYSKLVVDIKRGLSLTECQKLHNLSRHTVIKVKRALKAADK